LPTIEIVSLQKQLGWHDCADLCAMLQLAKNAFEDREDHRTPCASGAIIRGRSSAINLSEAQRSVFPGCGEGHSFN
jgi:hypothetical protein